MASLQRIARKLQEAFPYEPFEGLVAKHECEECLMLRAELSGKSWEELSVDFLRENDDCLPLLTPAAYHAFLPAWLSYGLSDPEGGPATMALINMSATVPSNMYSSEQRRAIVKAAEFIHQADPFCTQDADSIERLIAIRLRWGPRVAG
jgi:hypothetical protein